MSVLKIKDESTGEFIPIPSIKGDTGDAAGFGTVSATVDANHGTPSVTVTASGEDTAKNFAFEFKNLQPAPYDDSELQNDFAVLQGQFDTAVSAVTTSTEVTDIRVGADGVTDTTAGASVRRQFTDLKSDLTSVLIPNTASGRMVSIKDGAGGIPVKTLTITINPLQSGSGNPSPTNIRPIHGWTGARISVVGTNVWDEEWETGSIYNGEPITSSVSLRSKNYIDVLPNTQYCLKCPDSTRMKYIFFYDIDKTYLSNASAPSDVNTFTTPSDCFFIKFTYEYYIQDYSTYIDNISINYPSSDADYHEYNGEVYPVDWESEVGTIYGGILNVTTGQLTVNMVGVDLGSLAWQKYAFGSGYTFVTPNAINPTIASEYNNPNMLCPIYRTVSWSEGNSSADKVIYKPSSSVIYINDSSYNDADALKTSLDGIILVYELATPQTYTLTPIEVKTILKENNIWADTGLVEICYVVDTKSYIDETYIDYEIYVTPEMFGAIGDGTADDTDAMQNAVNACCANNGILVLSSSKHYKLTETINITARMILDGNGAQITSTANWAFYVHSSDMWNGEFTVLRNLYLTCVNGVKIESIRTQLLNSMIRNTGTAILVLYGSYESIIDGCYLVSFTGQTSVGIECRTSDIIFNNITGYGQKIFIKNVNTSSMFNNIHGWPIDSDYEGSIFFYEAGESFNATLFNCYSDTYQYAIRSAYSMNHIQSNIKNFLCIWSNKAEGWLFYAESNSDPNWSFMKADVIMKLLPTSFHVCNIDGAFCLSNDNFEIDTSLVETGNACTIGGGSIIINNETLNVYLYGTVNTAERTSLELHIPYCAYWGKQQEIFVVIDHQIFLGSISKVDGNMGKLKIYCSDGFVANSGIVSYSLMFSRSLSFVNTYN